MRHLGVWTEILVLYSESLLSFTWIASIVLLLIRFVFCKFQYYEKPSIQKHFLYILQKNNGPRPISIRD